MHLQRVVVGGDGADHLGLLPEAPRQVRPDGGVGPLDLMIDGLAEVVQQAGPPRQLLVQPQLRGDGPGYVGHLEAVGERVLSVAEAELELSQGADQLRVHVLDPHLQDGGFPRREDVLLDVPRGFVDQLLDTRGVDAPVLDEALQGPSRDLPADGVEAAEGHGLRGVVDDQVHARQGLEGADVAPLPSDDASLHVVGRQGDDADRRVAGVLHRTALHGRDDDLPRLAVGLPLGLLLQILQTEPDEVLRLLLRLAEQDLLGLLAGQAGYFLQLRVLLPNERLELRAPLLQGLLPVPQLVLLVGDPVQLSVQVLLLLLDLALGPLELVAPILDVALGILAQPEDFLPGLGHALLLGPLGRLVRLLEHGYRPVLISCEARVVPGPQHQVADPGPGCYGHYYNKILHGTVSPSPHSPMAENGRCLCPAHSIFCKKPER